MNASDFEKLKKTIQEKKEERTRKLGQRDQLMTRLKDEFDCDSVDQARTKLDDLESDIKVLDGSISSKSKAIEEKYVSLIS